MNRNLPPRPPGFTLIELLVSMAILALMLVMLISLFDTFVGSVRRTGETIQAYEDARAVATLMGREMGAALVRTNKDRWLNLKVEADADGTAVYFAAPNTRLGSTTNMSFVSHLAYFWKTKDRAVYRAAFDTFSDPGILLATASSAQNTNYAANRPRLGAMTLAYRSGSPYGWISDPLMRGAMDRATNLPFMRNVMAFDVACHDAPPSQPSAPASTWSSTDSLPHYMQLRIGLVDRRAQKAYEQTGDTNLLRRMVITVPMLNRGVNGNDY